jgi:hypothetical protein
MASEDEGKEESEKVDVAFLKSSSEMRRLEREAIPSGNKVFPKGGVFEEFDVEKISIDSYEAALKSAEEIESRGIKIAKKAEKEKAERAAGQKIISEEELERLPEEKIEVLERSEQEIVEEERKLKGMKEKFAKLMSDIPKENIEALGEQPMPEVQEEPKPTQPKQIPPEKPREAVAQIETEVEEKPTDAAKVEEIKELSENFKKITMKKEEREKQERIRKMKKEIEDMLESG